MRFGVLLNMGAMLGSSSADVFDVTTEEAERADDLGYDELWVTEHHFIRFGINPSALTTAGFLLGRTQRVRVGTAVVLAPLCHPVDLAERTALLDQFSGGRFELGLGRGGYRRDYELLDVDFARWDEEPRESARRLIDIWTSGGLVSSADGACPDNVSTVTPLPRTRPHPPLLLATTSDDGVAYAARNNLALQHYFAMPVEARLGVEERYRQQHAQPDAAPDHLHTVIAIVTSDTGARDTLRAALRESFHAGNHPHVPQAPNRHTGPDGRPMGAEDMAAMVADNAILGPASQVVDELGEFITRTGARRITVFHEAIADRDATMRSLTDFAEHVIPQLRGASVT